ncbi:MAG: TonB-dependent receptor plug domain-containing protein [Sphingobium sp.]
MAIATIAAMLSRTTFLALAAPLLAVPAFAQSVKAPIAFDIKAGPLDRALAAYAQQAGVQLIYTPDVTASRTVHAIKGSYSAAAALEQLLRGSDIAVRQVSDGIIVLKSRRAEAPARSSADAASAAQLSEAEEEGRDIVVTGSHIRGASPAGTPARTLGAKDMARNGYASVAQALAALPGNFGGMATEQSALSFSDRSGTNTTLASGVNLRGLGPEATLVLVNGRRIAGAGLLGDFADISSIPMAAVNRVEVVTDGASAIYGSDAVAGVVNIILKDKFEGLETNIRLGSVTKASARDIQLSQTAGTRWATGSALLSYEYNRRSRLASEARDFARSADSSGFGGTDHRYPYSLPGNVLGFDAVTGGLEPAFAIPSGQDGTSLEPSSFLAGAVNLENFRTGTDLSPEQTRHSLFGALRQDVADTITASLEARFAHRRFDSRVPGYATILSVTPGNPWFVSPTASDSDLIGYAFTRELGATRTRGSAQSVGLTATLDAELGAGWKATTYAAYARQRDKSRNEDLANEYLLAEALGTVPDDPATPL